MLLPGTDIDPRWPQVMASLRLRLLLLIPLLLVLLYQAAAAQEPIPHFASPFVPADHWAIEAARRLDGLGLAPAGFDRGLHSVTRRELARLFERAAVEAQQRAPSFVELAEDYRARFREEFPASAAALRQDTLDTAMHLAGRVTAGYEHVTGRVLAGTGYDNGDDWTGVRRMGDTESGTAHAVWSGALWPVAAVLISPVLRSGDSRLDEAYVTVAWGNAGFWAGRRVIGFGPAGEGAIVLDSETAFDGGGFFLLDPVTLPSFLRYLGPVRVQAFLSRGADNGPIGEPWLWAARGTIAPDPRLTLGITRAALFGGDGNGPLTARNLAYVIIGKHVPHDGGAFENQVVSVDLRWRPPLGELLPAILYLEWGFDDSAGAWKDVPAIVAGAELAAVPMRPELAVGLQWTSFAASCCGNTIWYRNHWFTGGWAEAGRPLGHPLGGHGTEWLAYARADLLDARLRLSGQVFVRDRGMENLFAPDRTGLSRGGAFGLRFRFRNRFELVLRGAVESGERDWDASTVFTGVRLLF